MNRYLKYFIFKLLLVAVSLPVIADKPAIKVYDKGMDGGMRYYSVDCGDGNIFAFSQKVLDTDDVDNNSIPETNELDTSQQSNIVGVTKSLKQKFINLITSDKVEVCILSNEIEQCSNYKSIDVAAKAACDKTK